MRILSGREDCLNTAPASDPYREHATRVLSRQNASRIPPRLDNFIVLFKRGQMLELEKIHPVEKEANKQRVTKNPANVKKDEKSKDQGFRVLGNQSDRNKSHSKQECIHFFKGASQVERKARQKPFYRIWKMKWSPRRVTWNRNGKKVSKCTCKSSSPYSEKEGRNHSQRVSKQPLGRAG